MNVAAYITRFLAEQGVGHVFGYQGGAILKIVDEVVRFGRTTFVQNYHEQASAFCCDAYARVSGGLGVATATSGPGATNLITGIANAQFDSIPTLFLTGQDYRANITTNSGVRQNGFQDLDIVSVVRPITKYASLITDERDIRRELEKAVWYARSGRPGAVLLDIPLDIQFKEIDPDQLDCFSPPPSRESATIDLQPLVDRIESAHRPVILVGGGVRSSGATSELRDFVRLSRLPVVSTLNGLDAIEGSWGFAGLHGNLVANLAVQNADLLLALGARFGQRQVGKTPKDYTSAFVVHVDIDANELGRIFNDGAGFNLDLKTFLTTAVAALRDERLPDFEPWRCQIAGWREKYHSTAYMNDDSLDPVRFVEALDSLLDDDALLTNDVGQNQMWVAQGFRTKGGRRLLNSCGHGSMGYSLPAAVGCKLAFPKRQVVAFTGDGGFQMNIQELMLLSARKIPVKCIVFNNRTLGMIREVQDRYYKSNHVGVCGTEFTCVDLEKIAQAYGIGFARVEKLGDVDALSSWLSDDSPALIEVVVSPESKLSNRYDQAPIFNAERIDGTE